MTTTTLIPGDANSEPQASPLVLENFIGGRWVPAQATGVVDVAGSDGRAYPHRLTNGFRVNAAGHSFKHRPLNGLDAAAASSTSIARHHLCLNAGQRSMAGSVLVTVADAHENILPRLKEEAEKMAAGEGTHPNAGLGPAIFRAARDRIHDSIGGGIQEGAELLVHGRRPKRASRRGNFVGPAVLTKVRPEM
ncbi:MAG: aldehyde dehydrogenase family protein, partial [Acidobacteria bacterium]|nr:aldehyde dehydrogenase family protein [Acidobacteriota bacterium]